MIKPIMTNRMFLLLPSSPATAAVSYTHLIFGTFRLQCLQSTTREAAHMNLNTALMSHLQKPPMALKITLITFMIHPIFLFAFNFNLLQRLQLPGPCQRFP